MFTVIIGVEKIINELLLSIKIFLIVMIVNIIKYN